MQLNYTHPGYPVSLAVSKCNHPCHTVGMNIRGKGPVFKMFKHFFKRWYAPMLATAWCVMAAVIGLGGAPDNAAVMAARTLQQPRWIGVVVENIAPVMSQLLGLNAHQGLLIMQVIPGSPAQKAHLRAGDLLINIDGQPLLNEGQLVAAVNRPSLPPDEKTLTGKSSQAQPLVCRVVFIRAGKRQTADIQPTVRPSHLLMVSGGKLVIPPSHGYGTLPVNMSDSPGKTVTIGPGVVIRFGTGSGPTVGGPKWSQAVTVQQWIDHQGIKHVTLIFHGKRYDLHARTIHALPIQIQPLARMILRHTDASGPLTPQELEINIAILKSRMRMLEFQQTMIKRQIALLLREKAKVVSNGKPTTQP